MARERRTRRLHSDSDDVSSSSSSDRIRRKRRREEKRRKKEKKGKKHSEEHVDASSSEYSSSSDEERRRRRRKRRKEEKRKKKEKKEKKRRKHNNHEENEEQVDPQVVAAEIVAAFPALSGEFKQLLRMLDSGEGVDVSGIPDERLRALLERLFHSLNLSKVDQVYLLPEDSQPTLIGLEEVLKNVPDPPEIVVDARENHEGVKEPNKEDDFHGIGPAERPPSPPRPRVIGPAMPTPEMLAAAARLSEAEEALRQAEEELEQDPFVGPPPPAVVAEAESVNEAERFEEVTRILDPDLKNAYEILRVKSDATPETIKKRYWKLSLLVHPDKCSHPQAQEAFTTMNKAFQELQDPTKRATIDHVIAERKRKEEEEADLRERREAAEWRRIRGVQLAGDEKLLTTAPKQQSRDEWMTQLPPERKAGGPPSMHSTFFSKSEKVGRGDTSLWTDTPVERAQKAKMQYLEAYKQAALPAAAKDAPESQRSNELAKAVDRYNEKKRSESMVEKHKREKSEEKKKKKSKKAEAVEDWVGEHPWKPWDREKDLGAGRKSVKLDPTSMAQGLASRFGSNAGQRKFL